jgi:hypothetical protein
METQTQAQEIILVKGTSFATRALCPKDQGDPEGLPSAKEQLLEACWNGLLCEVLPEICGLNALDKKLFLWQVREGESILELDRSAYPTTKDGAWSIDPFLCNPLACMN